MNAKCIVFDCQDMPDALCHKYIQRGDKGCNDVYLEWYWTDYYTSYNGEPPLAPAWEGEIVDKEVQDWMLEQIPDLQQKVEDDYIVLIKHWW